MIVGSLWSIVTIYSVLMVPVENDENDDGNVSPEVQVSEEVASSTLLSLDSISFQNKAVIIEKNLDEDSEMDSKQAWKPGSMEYEEATSNSSNEGEYSDHCSRNYEEASSNSSDEGEVRHCCSDVSRLFRRPTFLLFIIHGAIQYGALLSIHVFLPPLLIESFTSVNNTLNSTTLNSTGDLEEVSGSPEELAQYRISLVISIFGFGGIIGVFWIGFILSWGNAFRISIIVVVN